MIKIQKNWMVPMAGAALFAAQSYASDAQSYSFDSADRVSLSFRYGLNISGKFKNMGSLLPSAGLTTPNGDRYNYDDGYVYNDIGNASIGSTWYFGYTGNGSNGSQTGTPQQIDMHRVEDSASKDVDGPGFEITYDHQIGIIKGWHNMAFGIEGAVNYMPVSFTISGVFGVNQVTDSYAGYGGSWPPPSSYSGNFDGPGVMINNTPSSHTVSTLPGATLQVQDKFDANLFGIRLGPYVEVPLTEKLNVHASVGLAAGLMDAKVDWKETLTSNAAYSGSGSGTDLGTLWGGYASAAVTYQITRRWGVEADVQFQDMGTYSHNFAGRTAELNLSQSLFLQAGVSYSF